MNGRGRADCKKKICGWAPLDDSWYRGEYAKDKSAEK
jgi:hypothetical protein